MQASRTVPAASRLPTSKPSTSPKCDEEGDWGAGVDGGSGGGGGGGGAIGGVCGGSGSTTVRKQRASACVSLGEILSTPT